jgi:hypothetical protein
MTPYSIEQLRAEAGTLIVRELDDGRVLALHVDIYNYTLTISTPGDLALGLRSDVWEYSPDLYQPSTAALLACVDAINTWDGEGEPTGWTRHPATGRRRRNGDPRTQETRA